jgi:sigma-E factor negative regulatory protein RseC
MDIRDFGEDRSDSHPARHKLVEGVARVVAIENGFARFEPEQHGGCSACASTALCNDKGIGTLASRLEARRFELPDAHSLKVGDRVVLGVEAQSLLAASAVAYLIPLMSSLLVAALAEWRFSRDGATALAALAGLALGFLIVKWVIATGAQSGPGGCHIVRRAEPIEPHRQ